MSNASKRPVRIVLDFRPTATDPPPDGMRVMGLWDADGEPFDPSEASMGVCDYSGGRWSQPGRRGGCAPPSHWCPVGEMTASVETAESPQVLTERVADACERAGLSAHATILRTHGAGLAEMNEAHAACRALLRLADAAGGRHAHIDEPDWIALATARTTAEMALDQMRRG